MDQILGILDGNALKCNYCGQEPSPVSFLTSIALYGVIFLVGKDDGYVGIVCPNPACGKTAVQKRDSKSLYSLKTDLLSMAGRLEGSIHSRLRYYSVPYLHSIGPEIIPHIEHRVIRELFNLKESFKFYDFPDETGLDEPLKYPEGYCSYFLGDIAMGAAMEVLWYKKDSIDTLVTIENETGRIVFPRYNFYDHLRSIVDDFCWAHFFREIYVNWVNEGDPFLPMSVDTMNVHQRRVKATYDFMSILNAIPPEKFSESLPSSFVSFLMYSPAGAFTKALESLGLGKDENTQADGAQTQGMMADLWREFTKPHIQKFLSQLFVRFVSAFINTKQLRTSSCLSIWNLKEKALRTAHDSFKSEYVRRKAHKQLAEKQRHEVAEIEKKFELFRNIVTQDYCLNEMKLKIARVAGVLREKPSFLILGESGTGKELFAQAMHQASGRKGKFIPCDCGAKSETLFESQLFGHVKGAFTGALRNKAGDFELADGGTIFLDEIGNLSLNSQAKILRVLDQREIQRVGGDSTKKIDAYVVLATKEDLNKMVEDRTFRGDLYQRFKRPQLIIPPLRERMSDIPLLVEHFVENYDSARKKDKSIAPIRVTRECMRSLMKFDWREGNVRELAKVIEEIMVTRAANEDRSDITTADLPPEISQRQKNPGKQLEPKKVLHGNQKVTKEQIADALRRNKKNKSAAARDLRISARHMRRLCNTPARKKIPKDPV